MIPSAAVVEREKAKTKTTLNVMQGSMKAEYAEEIVGDTVRGFVDPRGSFDTSDRMYLKAQLEAEREKANRLAQDERDKLLVFRLASGNNAPPPTIVVATALAKDDKPSVQLSKPNVKVKKRLKGNGDMKESRKKKKDVDDKSTTTEASEDMKKKTDGPSALGGLVAYGSDDDSDAEKGSDKKRED